jgi:hypothetical protein
MTRSSTLSMTNGSFDFNRSVAKVGAAVSTARAGEANSRARSLTMRPTPLIIAPGAAEPTYP